jgi:hypothetical protein
MMIMILVILKKINSMKRKILLNPITLIALFSLITFSTKAQGKKFQVAVVGFYNLENFFDTINDPTKNDEDFLPTGSYHYTGAVYKDKVSKLSDVISLIGTDVSPDGLAMMGCAEVENDTVLNELVHSPKLISRGYKTILYNAPEARSIDVGLIYNPKYFTPKFSQPLFVPLFDADGKPRYTRDVLYVEGELLGEKVFVFVNHWPSRRGGEEASAPSRAIAAAVGKHKIDSITKINPDAKIILMGDLNDDPVSPSVAKVIGAKGDTHEVKRGDMYNPWMNYYKQGIGTLAYNDAWNLFDQIIISSAWLDKKQKGLFLKEANIFKKPWMLQQSGRYKDYPKRTFDFNNYIGGYSDHFPTYLVLLKSL